MKYCRQQKENYLDIRFLGSAMYSLLKKKAGIFEVDYAEAMGCMNRGL